MSSMTDEKKESKEDCFATSADSRISCSSKETGSGSCIPLRRQDLLKWNGWGYRDSKFVYEEKNDVISFTGNRYRIGNKRLPLLKNWAVKTFHAEFDKPFYFQPEIPEVEIPKPIIEERLLSDLEALAIHTSLNGQDRLFRGHGHTLREAYILVNGMFPRIPDIVVWPKCSEDVIDVVSLASKHHAVIIPFGGGTSVSGGLECPEHETRTIISLDTSQMNRVLFIDHENLTGRFEAGIIGQDLEKALAKHGLCTGHEPDSFEFSSLGGWVATRASGMKKNIYGNIEDLLVHVKLVTPTGVLEKNCQFPRTSCGPDVHHVVLGSEGTLGVITEVTLKLRPLPEVKKYGSIVMPDFESGVSFMREVARQRLKPASVRLVDNEQFIFGQALKPEAESYVTEIYGFLKRLYVTKIKGFEVSKMCVVTLLFEGSSEEVSHLEEKIYELGKRFGGLTAGEENGKRGYMLTFVIAYLRDLAMKYGIVGESFETSISWSHCLNLCINVKERIKREAKRYGLRKPILITCRVTQTYDSGACVYFYFAFNHQNGFEEDALLKDPVQVYEEIEASARDEILSLGGSLSHHHGIGKIRKKWMEKSVSSIGLQVLKAVKDTVDPDNIFANDNLLDNNWGRKPHLKSKL